MFVDWHGVLCDDVFWRSISGNPRHQQRRWLDRAMTTLFQERVDLAVRWMRGDVHSNDVISTLGFADGRCREDFLYRRLLKDCRSMRPRIELLGALAALPPLTLTVIATDNMDCFSDSLPSIRPLWGRVDAVLCSSDLGVLKAESPERFFGACLHEHGLSPEQAVLIDDSERNCERFRRFGGAAIRFDGDVVAVRHALEAWTARSPTIAAPARPSSRPTSVASAGTDVWRSDS